MQGSVLRSVGGVGLDQKWTLTTESFTTYERYSPTRSLLSMGQTEVRTESLSLKDTVQRLYSWSHSEDPIYIPGPLKSYLFHPLFSFSNMHTLLGVTRQVPFLGPISPLWPHICKYKFCHSAQTLSFHSQVQNQPITLLDQQRPVSLKRNLNILDRNYSIHDVPGTES